MYDKYAEHIGKAATGLLRKSTDCYASSIWTAIEEDVVADVLGSSSTAHGKKFTDDDIALAIGRAICTTFGAKVL